MIQWIAMVTVGCAPLAANDIPATLEAGGPVPLNAPGIAETCAPHRQPAVHFKVAQF
jgi:hypothetical protein